MSRKNYMGKIDEDWSGTPIPNYDNFTLCPTPIKTPQQVLDEARNEFENEFVVEVPDPEHIDYGRRVLNPKYPETILDWHTNTITAFIEAEIMFFKKMRYDEPTGHPSEFSHKPEWYNGYNQAIDDVVKYLEEMIKHLKEVK